MDVKPSASQTTLPSFAIEIIDKLNGLSRLGENWDSRGAFPVAPDAAHGALNVLRELMFDGVRVPAIVPNPDGGIVIEWVATDLEIIINVDPKGSAHVSIDSAGHEWDGPWPGCRTAMLDLLSIHTVKSWA